MTVPDESNPDTSAGRKDGFFKGLTKVVARKAFVPLAASAATAGTTYLMRKSADLWQQKVLPRVEEKGGGRAVVREALETVAGRLGGRRSEALSALAEKLGPEGGGGSSSASDVPEPEKPKPDDRRDEERRERSRRRQQRQRALEQSGSS
jgi:hypothetical protein